MSQTADTTRSIVMERDIPHPAEKVWRALTDASLMEQWLMANDFQPIVGHTATFRMDRAPQWNGVAESTVLVVEPYRRLSYTWNATGADAATGPRTVVTWTLTPTTNGVRLRMEHSGFRAHQEHSYKGASGAWPRFLAALEQLVATI